MPDIEVDIDLAGMTHPVGLVSTAGFDRPLHHRLLHQASPFSSWMTRASGSQLSMRKRTRYGGVRVGPRQSVLG